MGEAHAQTLDRSMALKAQYTVVEMWECEYERLLKADGEMRDFVARVPVLEKLEPRDAFFGGRTNAVKLHYKAKEGERIEYYDVVSLYPYINKYGKMPVGHPQIILFKPLQTYVPGQYYGFLKCKVLPPQKLFHPVLPFRTLDRLLFPLCRTCAELRQNEPCSHTEEERAITGTWITPEIDHAIQRGYIIQETYEAWHYERTAEYGTVQQPHPYAEGLFGGYVNALLKIKQEASGWPSYAVTDEDKDRFWAECERKEG